MAEDAVLMSVWSRIPHILYMGLDSVSEGMLLRCSINIVHCPIKELSCLSTIFLYLIIVHLSNLLH